MLITEPKFDDSGYPSEETFSNIENWDANDPQGLFAYVQAAWNENGSISQEGQLTVMATGGWSGNEDVIQTLQSTVFWKEYWVSSQRGGLHKFKITLD